MVSQSRHYRKPNSSKLPGAQVKVAVAELAAPAVWAEARRVPAAEVPSSRVALPGTSCGGPAFPAFLLILGL